MNMIPELVPLTELQAHTAGVLSRVQQGAIVLTQNDRAAAVLVEPKVWNDMLMELEDLRDTLDALDAYAAYQQEPDAVRPWREIRVGLVAEGLLDG